MTLTSTTLHGCLTALVTPFHNHGVDFDALARLVDWQIDQGVDGIVAVGTTGESATLSVKEHVDVIAAIVKAARGRVPVIAGAGGNATSEALELTAASADAGAVATLQVTPYYNKPTQEGLVRHYEAIAKASSLPIILYNVPGRTACDMLPETVLRVCEFDNVIGIKEASGSLVRMTDLVARCGDKIAILSGDDATAFPGYVVGSRGVISVVSNIAPALMSTLWDLSAAGKWDEARAVHMRLRQLNHLLFVESNPIPVKAALAMVGRIANELRLPMTPAVAATQALLKAELAVLGIA